MSLLALTLFLMLWLFLSLRMLVRRFLGFYPRLICVGLQASWNKAYKCKLSLIRRMISGCCMRIVMFSCSVGLCQIRIIVYFNFCLLNVIPMVDHCVLEVIIVLTRLLQFLFINRHL